MGGTLSIITGGGVGTLGKRLGTERDGEGWGWAKHPDILYVSGHDLLLRPGEQVSMIFKILPQSSCNSHPRKIRVPGRTGD